MEATKNTSALILGREPYRESDCLVSVYTLLDGKQSLIARGAKKLHSKLAGHIEPLTLADIMIVKGRGRDYIGSAIGRIFYSGIKSDLNKLYYAGQALSLFSRLVKEGQADERLFFLLNGWLAALDGAASREKSLTKASGELFLAFFIWKFLAALGYGPEMRVCLLCQKPLQSGKNYFNLHGGGLVCGECRENRENRENRSRSEVPGLIGQELLTISDNCVKILRFISDNGLETMEKLKVDKKSLDELTALTNSFVKFCC